MQKLKRMSYRHAQFIDRCKAVKDYLIEQGRGQTIQEVADHFGIINSTARTAIEKLNEFGHIKVFPWAVTIQGQKYHLYAAAHTEPFNPPMADYEEFNRKKPKAHEWGNGKLAHLMGYCNHQVTSKPSRKVAQDDYHPQSGLTRIATGIASSFSMMGMV